MLKKPAFGEPCNGCGMCCTVEPCAIAKEFLHCITGPCVALETDDNRTYCGMVRRPVFYLLGIDAPPAESGEIQSHVAGILRIGAGCDSDDLADKL